jgi:hypothetical protein
MFGRLCGWFDTTSGKCLAGLLSVVGGLHLFLNNPQPVFGFLPAFNMTIGSVTVGAQQLVGVGLLLAGVCGLSNCRSGY